MKICILGTRGIPNNYGGFEECAEYTSKYFAQRGHDVTVYCPDYHQYNSETWESVRIKKIFSRENVLGPIGNLIYEFLSIKDAVKGDFDIILELGTEYALFTDFFKKGNKKLVTNVDGLETRREKWSKTSRAIIGLSERRAISQSDAIVADNPEIKKHVDDLYKISSHYIGYGAVPRNFQMNFKSEQEHLQKYGVEPDSFCLLIARLEPENNIEMIVDGYLQSRQNMPLLIVGPYNKPYGKSLLKKYSHHQNIKFLGGIYNNVECLNTLRHYSRIYFHGHSVGGTNPALLQAMAQGALIFAHDNKFNRYVLSSNAYFFKSSDELAGSINTFKSSDREIFSQANFKRLETEFNWEKISLEYLLLFERLMNQL
jgi:glycosyltransferase involved in cell wall biosynthesis